MGSFLHFERDRQPDTERHLREARPDVEGPCEGAGLGVLHVFRREGAAAVAHCCDQLCGECRRRALGLLALAVGPGPWHRAALPAARPARQLKVAPEDAGRPRARLPRQGQPAECRAAICGSPRGQPRDQRGLPAFLAKSRAATAGPAATTYRAGDPVFYWRGLGKHKAKKHWAARRYGPAVAIGREANDLWPARRNRT